MRGWRTVRHLTVGDAMADRVVEDLAARYASDEVSQLIGAALRDPFRMPEGLPASLRELVSEVSVIPDWYDPELAHAGIRGFIRNSNIIPAALAGAAIVKGLSTLISKSFRIRGPRHSERGSPPPPEPAAPRRPVSSRRDGSGRGWMENDASNPTGACAVEDAAQGFRRMGHGGVRHADQRCPHNARFDHLLGTSPPARQAANSIVNSAPAAVARKGPQGTPTLRDVHLSGVPGADWKRARRSLPVPCTAEDPSGPVAAAEKPDRRWATNRIPGFHKLQRGYDYMEMLGISNVGDVGGGIPTGCPPRSATKHHGLGRRYATSPIRAAIGYGGDLVAAEEDE